MQNKKEMIKLPVRFDLVNEVIYKSILIILFGLAYLFAFNLLRFNWYSLFLGLIVVGLIYFKSLSYLKIEKNYLEIYYFNYYQKTKIKMNQIDECVFYDQNSLVELKTKENRKITIYLKERNKEKLLNWMIKNYPNISPIYIEKN